MSVDSLARLPRMARRFQAALAERFSAEFANGQAAATARVGARRAGVDAVRTVIFFAREAVHAVVLADSQATVRTFRTAPDFEGHVRASVVVAKQHAVHDLEGVG